MLCRKLFACVLSFSPDNNETILPTSTASPPMSTTTKCSPRWIVRPAVYAPGSSLQIRHATTQRKCLEACIANSSCFDVEWWDFGGCWMHLGQYVRTARNRAVTAFEINRQCEQKPGITRNLVFSSATWAHYGGVDLRFRTKNRTRRQCIAWVAPVYSPAFAATHFA